MAKFYLVTDNDLELLLRNLALEKFEGAKYVQVLGDPRPSTEQTQRLMNEVHRRFHYEVSSWMGDIKK